MQKQIKPISTRIDLILCSSFTVFLLKSVLCMYIYVKRGFNMEVKKEVLLLKIEYYRRELIKVGSIQGYCSPETIELSKNLDKLILKYQKLLH
jgi:hypothetical protein